MRVTIPLEGREPFAAKVGADRWVLIPKGTKPTGAAFSECEVRYAGQGDDAFKVCDSGFFKSCAAADMNASYPEWYYIRPTRGRSWSDIGLAEQEIKPMTEYSNPVTVEGPISVKLWREGSTAWMQVLAMPEHLRGKHKDENPIVVLNGISLCSAGWPDLHNPYVYLRGKFSGRDHECARISCDSNSDANFYLARVAALIRHANTLPLVKGDEPAEQPAQDPGWTFVYTPVPLDHVEEVQFYAGKKWVPSSVEDGHEWASALLRAGRYRVRYKPGYPKPQPEPQSVCQPVTEANFIQQVPLPPDPRIAELEAENAALRWLVNAHRIEFISVNGCLITNASRAKAQAEPADNPHFLAARAAMERKP